MSSINKRQEKLAVKQGLVQKNLGESRFFLVVSIESEISLIWHCVHEDGGGGSKPNLVHYYFRK